MRERALNAVRNGVKLNFHKYVGMKVYLTTKRNTYVGEVKEVDTLNESHYLILECGNEEVAIDLSDIIYVEIWKGGR